MDNSAASVLFKNVTTSTHDASLNVLKLIQFIFYAVSGLSAVISSFIIIFTIIFSKCLHSKDFFLLAGLAGKKREDITYSAAQMSCPIPIFISILKVNSICGRYLIVYIINN